MYKDVLQSIEGIEFYTIIPMILFFLFFVGMIIWLLKVDKKYIKTMSELPLQENNNQVSNYSDESK